MLMVIARVFHRLWSPFWRFGPSTGSIENGCGVHSDWIDMQVWFIEVKVALDISTECF